MSAPPSRWIRRPAELQSSPAFRVLSLSALRVLHELEVAYARSGNTRNGELVAPYADLVALGMDRNAIPPALRELEALGLVEVTERGRGGNAAWRRPSMYRLTYLSTIRRDPTNEWRLVRDVKDAKGIAQRARDKVVEPSAGRLRVAG